MNQTLYALAALFFAGLLVYNTSRARIQTELSQIDSEIEMQASGVASELLDFIGTLPFDADIPADDPNDLTAPEDFGMVDDDQGGPQSQDHE